MVNIRNPKASSSEHLKQPLIIDEDFPLFSFKYMVENTRYSIDSEKATKDLKALILKALHNYSKRKWSSFIGDKRTTGVENIPYDGLKKRKVNLPNNDFYNKVKKVTIFRVSNNNARLVCYRERCVSYILWIDWDLSSYDHGS